MDANFNPDEYFRDIIGVTRPNGAERETVRFVTNAREALYIRTKPLHLSQREVGVDEDGNVTFEIDVIVNFELQRDILSFGENITVLAPQYLADKIRSCAEKITNNYEKNE